MKPTKISSGNRERMSNHIEEYFAEAGQSKEVLTSKELFRANKEDVDIKTELSDMEIVYLNILKVNQQDLISRGITDVYDSFINNYLRLKISKERKSRGEFVTMNTHANGKEDVLDTMSKISNITGAKK